jgi:hypothetical protein
MTDARFVTTTEVYPDSPTASPAQCNQAQVAAVNAFFLELDAEALGAGTVFLRGHGVDSDVRGNTHPQRERCAPRGLLSG